MSVCEHKAFFQLKLPDNSRQAVQTKADCLHHVRLSQLKKMTRQNGVSESHSAKLLENYNVKLNLTQYGVYVSASQRFPRMWLAAAKTTKAETLKDQFKLS